MAMERLWRNLPKESVMWIFCSSVGSREGGGEEEDMIVDGLRLLGVI